MMPKARCRPEQLGCCCGPRFLIKPLKRWAYRRGRTFTDTFCRTYLRKYVKKWLTKWQKSLPADGSARGSSLDFPAERHGPIVDKLVAALPFNAQHTPNEQLVGAIVSALSDNITGEEKSVLEMARHLAVYAIGLKVAIASNIGLSHSKVREYWFNRGPRMLATMLFFCAFTVAVQEVMHSAEVAEGETASGETASVSSERSTFDRLYTVVIASMALIISTFMLYFRLPDSIEASIARTAHDFYRAKKTSIRAVQEALLVPV